MDAWEYTDIVADQAAAGRLYHEFLRVPDLSAGLYVLEAGAADPQSPHTEDELYFVVAGRAQVTVGGETRPVLPGSLVFVAANVRTSTPSRSAWTARDVRPRRGRPRLTTGYPPIPATASRNASASSAPRPTSSWRKNAYTSSPADRNGSIRAAQAASSASL